MGTFNIMENRKQLEIEYYDTYISSEKEESHLLMECYDFLNRYLKDKCKGKKILDYGCGKGFYSSLLSNLGGEVTGIDLSKESLKIAKQRTNNCQFLLMDCEDLKFDKQFDIIFDRGTFSSIDFKKALPELSKVLKKDGFIIGIETLGHNPFLNLKRRLSKRTDWAKDHILRMEDLKYAENFFKVKAYFFHIVSWIAFPFIDLPGGKYLLKLLETIDHILLRFFPFLKRYSFKTVFIFTC